MLDFQASKKDKVVIEELSNWKNTKNNIVDFSSENKSNEECFDQDF